MEQGDLVAVRRPMLSSLGLLSRRDQDLRPIPPAAEEVAVFAEHARLDRWSGASLLYLLLLPVFQRLGDIERSTVESVRVSAAVLGLQNGSQAVEDRKKPLSGLA